MMHWIDWIVMLLPVCLVLALGYSLRRYVRSVSAFLAGNRLAGRYLLAVAGMESGMSLMGILAMWEQAYRSGFAIGFWGTAGALVGMVMTLTGFVNYRFRETRAMTLGQFLEMRYSRKFRLAAGAICYVSGVLNYALFPILGARFFIFYCGVPSYVSCFGVTVPTTGLVMALFLGIALSILFAGEQVSCMVTDCLQGIFSYLIFSIIVVCLLYKFSSDMFITVFEMHPPGESFVNPYDTGNLKDFNILFVILGIIGNIYNRMAWQGSGGYNSAAISPHEQKMAGMLSGWREGLGRLKGPLLMMGGYILLCHPAFSSQADQVMSLLRERIVFDSPVVTETIRRQMTIPLALQAALPVGIVGAFAAMMFMAMLSTDTTYLQSWGSILVQDVILPLRRNAFKPAVQLWVLRLSILLVAVFAWFFGMYFQQVTYIWHFMAMTGAIWLGFAGTVIIGGLYWRRGTAGGAWAAATVGVTLGCAGFWFQSAWPGQIYPWLSDNNPGLLLWMSEFFDRLGSSLPIAKWEVGPKRFPLSGAEWNFLTMLACILSYVTVSLCVRPRIFPLEKMLHREENATRKSPVWNFQRLLTITPDYTKGDRFLAYLTLGWNFYNVGVFLVIVLWNAVSPWSERAWMHWFYYYTIGLALLIGTVTTVWFTWGGSRDLLRLLRRLREAKENAADDGRVEVHYENPGE